MKQFCVKNVTRREHISSHVRFNSEAERTDYLVDSGFVPSNGRFVNPNGVVAGLYEIDSSNPIDFSSYRTCHKPIKTRKSVGDFLVGA